MREMEQRDHAVLRFNLRSRACAIFGLAALIWGAGMVSWLAAGGNSPADAAVGLLLG
jgi:hypothetical protein